MVTPTIAALQITQSDAHDVCDFHKVIWVCETIVILRRILEINESSSPNSQEYFSLPWH